MQAYLRAPRAQFAQLGESWVAFSGVSGETHVLNTESVALVETLDEHTPRTAEAVAADLALETGTPVEEMTAMLSDAWPMLLQAGLVRVCGSTACDPA
ncbi:HPr-rel-A system PqqD family peptide chaperone [Rubrivivax rivuli]|uniref:HPr-rel-A system PqqD family peptide chaperone n=1 Tax=Rubrivivax rivuli TaxID=1862385 RepID=A0A437RSE1_9BURK|nr:HPr-rel-A system PqqD family peptide chaperone [Rubrivivax rivuli]RVU49677.1 HPr-rel-A system PqqD family peptide chaperone [Rubrivivax rivuli]